MHRIVALLPAACLLTSLAVAQTIPFQLDLMTHMNTANELIAVDNHIYAATEGGLIAYDIASGEVDTRTALDGMFDHHLTALDWSSRGLLILGSVRGNVAFYDLESGGITNNENLVGNEIRDIVAVEDTLWVLTPDFVSVFLFDDDRKTFQFRETYQEFGGLTESFKQMALAYNRIWIAGNTGLLSGPSNFLRFNLYAGSNWQILTTESGLPVNSITDLVFDDSANELVLATESGLSALRW